MTSPPRSADILVNQLLNTPGLLDQVHANPEKTLKKVAEQITKDLLPPAYLTDRWIYRIVVLALGFVSVASIGGAIYLSAKVTTGGSVPIPDIMTALGAAAIGALAGLLAPSPQGK